MSARELVDVIYPGVVVTVDVSNTIEQGLLDEPETTGEVLLAVADTIKAGQTHLLTPDGWPVLFSTQPPVALVYRTEPK